MHPDFRDIATQHLARALTSTSRTVVVATTGMNGLYCATSIRSERPRELIRVARSLIQEASDMLNRGTTKMDGDEMDLLLAEVRQLDRAMVLFPIKHGLTASEEGKAAKGSNDET